MTLKEIAKEAGVSPMTVSNVVNRHDSKVSEATRKRVQAVIDKYGYVPNMSARSLSSTRSRIVALVMPVPVSEDQVSQMATIDPALAEAAKNVLTGHYISTMVGFLESKLKNLGYYTMLRSYYRAEEVLELQRNWKMDGCIVLMPQIYDAENRLILTRSSCPVVMLDRFYPDLPMLSVGSDDYHGGYLAAQTCIRYGHRKFAFVCTGAPDMIDQSTIIRERYQGYLAALRDACIPAEDCMVLGFRDSLTGGRSCGRHILSMKPEVRPTALVVTSDSIAIGAVAALKSGGLRVPEDISVIGYDDLPMAALVSPPLTTVSQDLDAKASAAAALLKMQIDDPGMAADRIILDVKVAMRQTVGRAPGT